jgi:hypothetical protein
MKRIEVVRIARPRHVRAAGGRAQHPEIRDLPGRRVITRFPFWKD